MAHQTGIEPSDELKALISTALTGSVRLLQILIKDEALVPGEHSQPKGNWEEDWDALVAPVLTEEACYIFYRLDDRNAHQNFLWVFMSYIPNNVAVREKMLYAATKATVRKAFSSAVIIDDVSASEQTELSLAGYRRHMETQAAAPPLTQAEEELKQIRENEEHADIGTTTKQSHLHGVAFPVEQDAIDALIEFKNERVQYVQLSIDVKAEKIMFQSQEADLDADSIGKHVPEDSPRYHLYRFKHTHEGDYQEAIVFIYTQPGFRSTIKERMLYSSCKEALIGVVENLHLSIDKKVETDGGSELNEAFLLEEVHPPKAAYRPAFMKPPPPSGRKRSRSPGRPPHMQSTVPNGSNGSNGSNGEDRIE